MRLFMGRIPFLGILFAVFGALSGRANALLIVPTFDTSITGNGNAAVWEAAVNTAVGAINGLYGNAGTVPVLFAFNSGVNGAESLTDGTFVPYSQYTAALATDSSDNPSNTVLRTAVANFGGDKTADYVLANSAQLRVALGVSTATPCLNANGSAAAGCNGTYDGIVTFGNLSTSSNGAGFNSGLVSAVEHELDEVLGGGGPGSTIGRNLAPFLCPDQPSCGLTAIGSTDLYRFHSSGPTCANVTSTPSFTTNAGEIACYSVNGGQSALITGPNQFVQFNEAGGGSDYGDFAFTGTPEIQDAFVETPTAVYSPASPEFTMLESIGYDPIPEPSTLALLTGAFGGLRWLRRRRARPC